MRHLNQPWLLTPAGFARLQRDQEQRKTLKPGATASDLIVEYPPEPSVLDANGIAHLHITGVIGYRLDWIDRALGNTDIAQLRADLYAALKAGARGLMIHVNSPGGGVVGLLDFALELRAVACGLPIHAYSDLCACSAAYWIACASTRFTTSLTAAVGSIGIYLPWIDKSLAFTAAGLVDQPFTNDGAIYKGAGNGPSLTPEQRAQVQDEINRLGEMFTGFVSTCRPQARFDAMRGQTFHGLDAPAAGLTDGLGTREQAYLDLCLAAGVEDATAVSFSDGLALPTATFKPLAYDPDQPRDPNGEFASGNGGSEGTNPKDGSDDSNDDPPPSLSSEEQEFVDSNIDPTDEDDVDAAVKAGAITREEGDRALAIAASQSDFDVDDPATWDALHGFPNVEERDGSLTGAKYGVNQGEINQEKLEAADEAYDAYDRDDTTTWGLSDEKANELAEKMDDVDHRAADDPDGWADAYDKRIAELGAQHDEIEDEDEQQKFAETHEAEVDHRLAAMKQELKSTAASAKADLKENLTNAKAAVKADAAKAEDANDRLTDEAAGIEKKMGDKYHELVARDNGSRD